MKFHHIYFGELELIDLELIGSLSSSKALVLAQSSQNRHNKSLLAFGGVPWIPILHGYCSRLNSLKGV